MTIAEKLLVIAENQQKVHDKGYEIGSQEGYDKGYSSGAQDGHDAGYAEGYAKGNYEGALQFYNFFNDTYLRSDYYSYTFAGTHWKDDIFLPNKDMKPIYIMHLFTTCAIVDIVGGLKRVSKTLDTSNATTINYIMKDNQYSTNFPTLDTSSCNNLKCLFYNCTQLQTIEKVILKSDGAQLFDDNYSFGKLPQLREIRFDGVIGQEGVNFSSSTNLSLQSYYSIIEALSTTTQGLTITFSKQGVNKRFKDGITEGSSSQRWSELAATRGNWNIKLV